MFRKAIVRPVAPFQYRVTPWHTLARFVAAEQSKCCLRLEERLAQDWRRAFSEQLVDSVQDIYDFFQSDSRLFASSSLFRLLKHLELRMNSQLRTLFTVSYCREEGGRGVYYRSCV